MRTQMQTLKILGLFCYYYLVLFLFIQLAVCQRIGMQIKIYDNQYDYIGTCLV